MKHSYKLAIVGGNGKVGRFIAKRALEEGYQVRMLVRNPTRLTNTDERIEIVKGDAQDINSIRSFLQGCHIVINTIGQPLKDFPIYSVVTKFILTAMNELEIRRYIGVTGGSLDINGDKKNIINKIGARIFRFLFPKMMADKKMELEILARSDVDWTLVRLPFVVEGSSAGNIKESLTDMPGIKITNIDIADFIINQISDNKYIRKTPFIAN
ncbi:NAD(P)H-binding protein [Peribacillus frigoritolerans]|uniref:NAD(P)-dependent oxidoreductase n=1 Tax=Peribacillus frigoritolerans TaxID=450367 RepID=UPI00345DADB5